MEKLVTVATFDLPAEARAIKLLLEDRGFDVLLDDDNLVGMNLLLSNAVGGAKLQVPESQAEQAALFVEEVRSRSKQRATPTEEPDLAFPCEECGREVTFPAARRGSVETCPHCGEYIDVP